MFQPMFISSTASSAERPLLGHARPELERARQALLLHDLLHRQRGGNLQRHPGVVPLTVPGRADHDRIAVGDARLLRRLRDAVDIRSERDHRFARSPRCHPRRRDAGEVVLDGEPVLLEDVGEVLRRLVLLEAELAEAEDLIVHALDVFTHAVDFERDVALVLLNPRVGRRRGGGRGLGRRLRRGADRDGDRGRERDNQPSRKTHG
jgi:hypothetical protein